MSDRILLLSADFGAGHLQAARAIAEACRRQNPHCTAEVVNIATPLLSLISGGYLSLLSAAPGAYRQLYRLPAGFAARPLILAALLKAVRREIDRVQPTAVIATHPFPGAAAAWLRRRGRLQATVSMAVTDFIPHPLWIQPGVDRYFVASSDAAAHLAARGVAPWQVTVSGIPIRPDFAAAAAPRPAGDPHRHVLVMGGGLGLGPIVEAVGALSALPQEHLRLTVVCGRNEALQQELQARFGTDPRLTVAGFTSQVPTLMAGADLLVTKPGGITCSEALACGLPMLLLRPLPGQEEENAAHLTATGAARVVHESVLGAAAADLLFGPAERLCGAGRLARLAGLPDAAGLVAACTLQSRRIGASA